jgi:predicted RNA-binding Zn ribbon-like protein
VSVRPTLQSIQRAGFTVGGEPSVAIDLVDTLSLAESPVVDQLDGRDATWWELESPRLPDGPTPEAGPTRRLRSALREAFEAAIDGRVPEGWAVDSLNTFADSVPSSPRLVAGNDGWELMTRWHREHGGDARLAEVARDGIRLLADPRRRAQLRRCANPTCSMLFLAENSRRVWCTANICGNRIRVARHHREHSTGAARN